MKVQVKTILGPNLVKAAKNGPKMLEVTATDDDLRELLGSRAFSKTLRFGATLDLVKAGFAFCSALKHLTCTCLCLLTGHIQSPQAEQGTRNASIHSWFACITQSTDFSGGHCYRRADAVLVSLL